MTTYAVAYISLFDNELTIEFVEAYSRKEAMALRLGAISGFSELDLLTFSDDEIQTMCFDADSLITAVEIPT